MFNLYVFYVQNNYFLLEYFRQRAEYPFTGLMLGWFRKENRLAAVLVQDLGWETIVRIDGGIKAAPGDEVQLMLLESGGGGSSTSGQQQQVQIRFQVTSVMHESIDADPQEEESQEEEMQ